MPDVDILAKGITSAPSPSDTVPVVWGSCFSSSYLSLPIEEASRYMTKKAWDKGLGICRVSLRRKNVEWIGTSWSVEKPYKFSEKSKIT